MKIIAAAVRTTLSPRRESVTFVSAPSLSLSPSSLHCRHRCSCCCGRHRLVAAVVVASVVIVVGAFVVAWLLQLWLLRPSSLLRGRGSLGRFIVVVVG